MHKWIIAAILIALGALLAAQTPATTPDERRMVVLLDVDGGIGPATTDHIRRGLRHAADNDAAALVLRINTPGGLDAATRDINREILASTVPVITWVAPEGARAASAGTYILYASHLAAMAPATSLGAASPVAIGGGEADGQPAPSRRSPFRPADRDGDADAETEGDDAEAAAADSEGGEREPAGSTAARKALNDAVAYLRGLAERHGRDKDFAEAAVLEAATLTASEALARGVIEVVSGNLDDLLEQADGREVRMASGTVTLAVAGAEVEAFAPDWRNRILSVITDPSVAYLLILVGLYGLLLEGYNPGALVPGITGAIALLIALYALQILPVNYAGLALIALGVALIAAEAFVPSFGALGIGGIVALMAGSLMLFDRDIPGYGISTGVLWGVGLGSAIMALGAAVMAGRARRRRVTTGTDELLGLTGRALADFQGVGRVHLRGEDWRATSERPVAAGQTVRVTAREGLTLRVEPVDLP
ncbi:MAG: NfeD family protein [Lysobacteraceae bacterium]